MRFIFDLGVINANSYVLFLHIPPPIRQNAVDLKWTSAKTIADGTDLKTALIFKHFNQRSAGSNLIIMVKQQTNDCISSSHPKLISYSVSIYNDALSLISSPSRARLIASPAAEVKSLRRR